MFGSHVFAVAFLMAGIGIANAQTGCYPRAVLAAELKQKYQEIPVAKGVTASGMAMEVYASPSGSWTATLVNPQTKVSCMVASGQRFSIDTPVVGQPI